MSYKPGDEVTIQYTKLIWIDENRGSRPQIVLETMTTRFDNITPELWGKVVNISVIDNYKKILDWDLTRLMKIYLKDFYHPSEYKEYKKSWNQLEELKEWLLIKNSDLNIEVIVEMGY